MAVPASGRDLPFNDGWRFTQGDPENAGVLATQLRQALEGKVPNRPFQLP